MILTFPAFKWTDFYYRFLLKELNKYYHCTNIYQAFTIY